MYATHVSGNERGRSGGKSLFSLAAPVGLSSRECVQYHCASDESYIYVCVCVRAVLLFTPRTSFHCSAALGNGHRTGMIALRGRACIYTSRVRGTETPAMESNREPVARDSRTARDRPRRLGRGRTVVRASFPRESQRVTVSFSSTSHARRKRLK